MKASDLVAGTLVLTAAVIAWRGLTGSAGPSVGAGPTPVTITAGAEVAPGQPANARTLVGFLPTRVVIPSAGIDAAVSEVGVVVQDGRAEWETAWRAAGHHIDSARPGQPGNMVLTGHVSVADNRNIPVFRDLDRVRVGDQIEVYSGGSVFTYATRDVKVVGPNTVSVLRSDSRSLVTLITCTKDLRQRLVVVGELQT